MLGHDAYFIFRSKHRRFEGLFLDDSIFFLTLFRTQGESRQRDATGSLRAFVLSNIEHGDFVDRALDLGGIFDVILRAVEGIIGLLMRSC